MADKRVLTTHTDVTIQGTNIEIYTYYTPRENDIFAFITDSLKTENGVSFVENELGYTKRGYDDVSFFINENGELVVLANNPDQFAIDTDGQLTITE